MVTVWGWGGAVGRRGDYHRSARGVSGRDCQRVHSQLLWVRVQHARPDCGHSVRLCVYVLRGVRVCHPENQLPSEVGVGDGSLTSVEHGEEEERNVTHLVQGIKYLVANVGGNIAWRINM